MKRLEIKEVDIFLLLLNVQSFDLSLVHRIRSTRWSPWITIRGGGFSWVCYLFVSVKLMSQISSHDLMSFLHRLRNTFGSYRRIPPLVSWDGDGWADGGDPTRTSDPTEEHPFSIRPPKIVGTMVVSVNVSNDVLLGCQECPELGSCLSTDLKCSDVTRSHPRM